MRRNAWTMGLKPAELAVMSLCEFREAVIAFNAANAGSDTLTDVEAMDLARWVDEMEAKTVN